jgi:uncharacterized protein (TIGR04552 family)
MTRKEPSHLTELSLSELARIRLLLDGQSVIDWSRLYCRDFDDVDELLARVGIAHDESEDWARLMELHQLALGYLEIHEYGPIEQEVRDPHDVRQLLLMASQDTGLQRDACAVLKVMHIIHHAAGRELVHRLSVPTAELFFRIERDVYHAVDEMKRKGISIVEWASSRKTEHSIITKLLCRKDSQAAQLHDRLRFRIVTETVDDVLGVLAHLCRYSIPFGYVVPGESRNELIDFESTLRNDFRLRKLWKSLQTVVVQQAEQVRDNHFTASSYRDVNFVVDMAVRVDDVVDAIPDFDSRRSGRVVFLLAEFQIVDRQQHVLNQTGESAHEEYKARQVDRAVRRLRCEVDNVSD